MTEKIIIFLNIFLLFSMSLQAESNNSIGFRCKEDGPYTLTGTIEKWQRLPDGSVEAKLDIWQNGEKLKDVQITSEGDESKSYTLYVKSKRPYFPSESVGTLKFNKSIEKGGYHPLEDSDFTLDSKNVKIDSVETVVEKSIVIAIIEQQTTSSTCSLLRSPSYLKEVQNFSDQPIPNALKGWMKEEQYEDAQVSNHSPFFIMSREVMVGEFRKYVGSLDEGKLKTLGDGWQQDREGRIFPDERPVSSVPWWAANEYAEWFSRQTHCVVKLPSQLQWKAAVVFFKATPKDAVVRNDNPDSGPYKEPSPGLFQREQNPPEVRDLLGNLREWSADKCADSGHYMLGEDYRTFRDRIGGRRICQSDDLRLDTIGFRLIVEK